VATVGIFLRPDGGEPFAGELTCCDADENERMMPGLERRAVNTSGKRKLRQETVYDYF